MSSLRSIVAGLPVLVLTAVTVLAVPACPALAQAAPAVPAPVPADKIRKIALIPCPEPEVYVALTKSGGNFGIVGAILAAVQTSENTDKMTAAMKTVQAHLGTSLTDTLEARLRAQNLEIVRISATHEKPYERLKDYSQIDTDADAILDIVIRGVGYFRVDPADDFAPGMRVDLRLVAPKTKQVILSDDPAYGLANNWVNKNKYDPKFVFSNMDRLRENLVLAKQGLEQGAVPIADEIAGKISEINSIGIAASMEKAKQTEISNDPDAKRNDDRGSN